MEILNFRDYPTDPRDNPRDNPRDPRDPSYPRESGHTQHRVSPIRYLGERASDSLFLEESVFYMIPSARLLRLPFQAPLSPDSYNSLLRESLEGCSIKRFFNMPLLLGKFKDICLLLSLKT